MDTLRILSLALCLYFVVISTMGEDLVNVATGKTYRQINAYFAQGPSSNAANGNTVGNFNSENCIHTGANGFRPVPNDTYHWWEVDLGRTYPVLNITVWARNAWNQRLFPFTIAVDGQTCVNVTSEPKTRSLSVACSSVMCGQVVRLTLTTTKQMLNMCEFQIFVCKAALLNGSSCSSCDKDIHEVESKSLVGPVAGGIVGAGLLITIVFVAVFSTHHKQQKEHKVAEITHSSNSSPPSKKDKATTTVNNVIVDITKKPKGNKKDNTTPTTAPDTTTTDEPSSQESSNSSSSGGLSTIGKVVVGALCAVIAVLAIVMVAMFCYFKNAGKVGTSGAGNTGNTPATNPANYTYDSPRPVVEPKHVTFDANAYNPPPYNRFVNVMDQSMRKMVDF